MTIDELKETVPYETVLETLCITAYNGTRLYDPMGHYWPQWLDQTEEKRERFRQSVYFTLPRAGTVNQLEKMLGLDDPQ